MNPLASCWIVDSLPQIRKMLEGGARDANFGRAELASPIRNAAPVQQKSSPEGSREKTSQEEECARTYEPGGGVSAGDSVVPAGDSVVPAGVSVVPAGDSVVAGGDAVAAAGLVSVAAAGLLAVAVGGLVAAGVAAGSVVSVFCSHAARSAAPARMQMYFFIVLVGRGILL